MEVSGCCRYRTINYSLKQVIWLCAIQNQGSSRKTITLLVLGMMVNVTGFGVFMVFVHAGMDHRGQLRKQNQQDSKDMPPVTCRGLSMNKTHGLGV